MIKLYILTTLVLLSFVSNSQSTLNINKGQANPTTTNGNVSEFGVSNQGDWILTWTYDESRCFLTNSNGNITSSTFDPYIYIVFKNIASNKDSFSLHVQGHKRGLMQLHYGFLSMPGFELIMPAPIFSHGTSLNIPCYDNSAVQISLNSYINTSGLSEGLTITSDFEWTIPSGWITADNQSGTFVAGPSISVIPPYSTNNTQITVRAKASSQYSNATTLQITRNIGSIYISGNSVVNCGQTYQFSAPFYNNVSYSWQLPNGWTGASSTNTINATVNGAKGNVILTVSACNQVSRDTFNVSDIKIFPDNAYLSGYTVNILCEPGINITAGNLFPNSYLTWTTSSNIVASNSSPSTFISPNGDGNGYLTSTVNMTCGSKVLETLNFWVGTPNYFLKVTDSYGGSVPTNQYGEPMACPNSDYIFTIRDNDLSQCYAYNASWNVPSSWSINWTDGNEISINTNDSPYNMISADVLDCCSEQVNVSLYMEINSYCGYSLVISPNPATTTATLKIETRNKIMFDENETWSYEIYSENQVLRQKKVRLKGSSTTVDLSGWKEGIYIINVNYKNSLLTGKVIIK